MLQEYFFKFSNGMIRKFTESGAKRFSADTRLEIIDCNLDGDFKNNKRIKDGFNPGWQVQLGMYVGDYGTYKRILKERGLVELGNEKPKLTHDQEMEIVEANKRKEIFSDESLKELANDTGGLDLSDGDVRMLRDSVQ